MSFIVAGVVAQDPDLDFAAFFRESLLGFDLTLGYGTAVLWTTNDTTQIARIEGSTAYTTAMKMLSQELPTDSLQTPQYPIPWLDELQCRFRPSKCDPAILAISQMLKALHSASEAFIPDLPLGVSISLPFDTWTYQGYKRILPAAVHLAGLNTPLKMPIFAGEAAAIANKIGHCSFDRNCAYLHEKPLILVLTVAYSEMSLTTSLMGVEVGEFNIRRYQQSPELGSHAVIPGHEEGYWEAVRDQIVATAQLPSPDRTDPDFISSVVLYGDRVQQDLVFQKVLKDALGDGNTKLAKGVFSFPTMADPVFAAAEGAMSWSWPWRDGWADEEGECPYNMWMKETS